MLILLRGETSTELFLTAPPDPILVESSLGPAKEIALRIVSRGFLFVTREIISKVCLTIEMARFFFPLFLPCFIRALVILSMMGHVAFLNLFFWYLPAVWGTYTLAFGVLTAIKSVTERSSTSALYSN